MRIICAQRRKCALNSLISQEEEFKDSADVANHNETPLKSGGDKMLSLIAKIENSGGQSREETTTSSISITNIITHLTNAKIQAETIGETEIQYLTSIALESAKEKMLLRLYNYY